MDELPLMYCSHGVLFSSAVSLPLSLSQFHSFVPSVSIIQAFHIYNECIKGLLATEKNHLQNRTDLFLSPLLSNLVH